MGKQSSRFTVMDSLKDFKPKSSVGFPVKTTLDASVLVDPVKDKPKQVFDVPVEDTEACFIEDKVESTTTNPSPLSEYGLDWLPTEFDDNVPFTCSSDNLNKRVDTLKSMKVGQSFALPTHLINVWRKTTASLNKTGGYTFRIKNLDGLFYRLWRLK